MNPAAHPARLSPASPFPDGPTVTVIFRPPCASEKVELFGVAPHGVEPEHVVKAICRALGVGPGALEVEPDPDARRLRDHDARCYVLDAQGARIAHITGLSFAWVRVEAARLATHGWTPATMRDPVQ